MVFFIDIYETFIARHLKSIRYFLFLFVKMLLVLSFPVADSHMPTYLKKARDVIIDTDKRNISFSVDAPV
jgi:hypothetical protein